MKAKSKLFLFLLGTFILSGFFTSNAFQSTNALLGVPSLNESTTKSAVNSPDTIALKMKFGKGDRPFDSIDLTIYGLKDQSFVVGNNNRICPDQNCKFQFKDADLAYQPGSNDITLDGTMKIDTGDVIKINKFDMRVHPTEAHEIDGQKTETVEGYFGIGKNTDADEFVYNVNGTIESQKGGKILSLQGVECNGNNNDPSKTVDCNY